MGQLPPGERRVAQDQQLQLRDKGIGRRPRREVVQASLSFGEGSPELNTPPGSLLWMKGLASFAFPQWK